MSIGIVRYYSNFISVLINAHFIMKKYLILIIVLIVSCTNKEKYYGEWIMETPSSIENNVNKIKITEDSISISSFPLFDKYSESLKLNGNELELLGEKFKLNIENDSLLYFSNATYVKKGYISHDLKNQKDLINLEHPDIENLKDVHFSYFSHYIYFGKKINSDEFGLLLNDRIAPFEDLKMFLFPHGRRDEFVKVSLTADKNSKMKDINEIFYYCRSVNARRIKLVNGINYYLNNGFISSTNEGLSIYLNGFEEENILVKNRTSRMIPPPPPPEYNSIKKIVNDSIQVIISLLNNELYYGLEKTNKIEIQNLIINDFKDKYFIILYDEKSTYKNYLELVNKYKGAFNVVKNTKSKDKFNKSFDSLSNDEKMEIIGTTPSYIIYGISFDDFKKLNITIPELELVN